MTLQGFVALLIRSGLDRVKCRRKSRKNRCCWRERGETIPYNTDNESGLFILFHKSNKWRRVEYDNIVVEVNNYLI